MKNIFSGTVFPIALLAASNIVSSVQAAEYVTPNANQVGKIQLDKLAVVDQLGNRFINSAKIKALDNQSLYIGQKYQVETLVATTPGVEDGTFVITDKTVSIPKLLQNQVPAYSLTLLVSNEAPYELTVVALSVVGTQGIKGDAGIQGMKGDKGDKGDKGEKGETGEKGATGATGAMGPQGPIGLTGAVGATGAQGPAGSSDAWGRVGNAGTSEALSFIGTTDNVPLSFRVNNLQAGRIDAAGDRLFLGVEAGKNSTGLKNTGLGFQALTANTSGSHNTAAGVAALRANTKGDHNTALGLAALIVNTEGYSNTATGSGALVANSRGYANTANGVAALFKNTVGNNNTAMGDYALSELTTGSNNTAIGSNAQVPNIVGNNQVRIGNNAVTYAGVQVGWTITSDSRWKADIQSSDLGLAFIKQLKPVVYTRKNDEAKKLEYGFIAQDIDALLKTLNISNAGLLSQDSNGLYSVRYNDFFAPIVKAIQEQQLTIEKQQAMLEKQQALIDTLINHKILPQH